MKDCNTLLRDNLGKEIDQAIKSLAYRKLKDMVQNKVIPEKQLDLYFALYRAIYEEKEDTIDDYYYAIMEFHPTPSVNISAYIKDLIRKKHMTAFFKIVLRRILMDSIWCLEEGYIEDDEENEKLLQDIIFSAVSVYNISKEIMSEELKSIFKFVLDAFVFEYGALVYHGN
ncbi:MAG: hypothetical protein DRN30_06715 [Thermoplasmata archaeon]|nr:hypothetical protein [Euryarchaeota archaeon]RLF63345.1 MAG: hypothetical protein DRN30_06715 [Thermoplasmata archaeon]